jgi:hypothetical protein
MTDVQLEIIDLSTGLPVGTFPLDLCVPQTFEIDVGDYRFTATYLLTGEKQQSDVSIVEGENPPLDFVFTAPPAEAEVFDNCDIIGDWKLVSDKLPPNEGDNSLEVDTTDKVEGTGSLKGTLGATAPNWGGSFYKRPVGTLWDFREKPLIRIRMKLHNPIPADADFHFSFVTSGPPDYPWDVFMYEIRDKLVIGEWVELAIDLRLPDRGPEGKFPTLEHGAQISIESWGAVYSTPVAISWDLITREPGPPIPPQAAITPSSAYLLVGETATFNVSTIGGVAPLTFQWHLDDQLQAETSNTFTFTSIAAGKFVVKCVVTDAQNQTGTVTASVEVVAPPPPPQPIPPSLDVLKSEMRAILVWNPWLRNPDWEVIAQTCVDYGFNVAIIELYKEHLWENGIVKDFPALRTAINAFHKRGMNVHVLLCVQLGAPSGMRTLRPTGEIDWLDVTKETSRQMLKAIAESLARDYDIDGFMFDYIRWEWGGPDMPLGEEARVKFIADTGLTDVNWYSDVLEGGRYYWQFIEWRMKTIDETVRDMRNWMRTIKPKLTFSAAVMTAFENCGNYFPMRLGQHAAEWVDMGYLHFVSPMLYGTDVAGLGSNLVDSLNFYTGGAEGKVPMIPAITMQPGAGVQSTPEIFVETLRVLKQRGADGWVLWAYGGPGINLGTSLIDMRPFLSAAIDAGLIKPVWAIQDLGVTINPEGTTAIVSWTTTIPTKSRIEYENVPLFIGTVRYGDFGRPFHYKDVDYVRGITQENITLKTSHSFTIPITTSTQFRIQNTDEAGITVTSSPMSPFEVPPPPVKYILTINVTEGGTTEPEPGVYEAYAGDIVTVTAKPHEGYGFKRFELDGEVKMQNPINVGMDADHTLLAVFVTTAPPISPTLMFLFLLTALGGTVAVAKKGGG